MFKLDPGGSSTYPDSVIQMGRIKLKVSKAMDGLNPQMEVLDIIEESFKDIYKKAEDEVKVLQKLIRELDQQTSFMETIAIIMTFLGIAEAILLYKLLN